MLPVKQYSFTIPAGGAFPQICSGRYFRVNACTGTLAVIDSLGNSGAITVGQGWRIKDKDPEFQRLTFMDTSGAPNNVKITVADADFVDNTLLGTVSVVDGGKARTLANAALGVWQPAPAVAANVSWNGLYNPAGSGKNLVIEKITIASAVNTGFVLLGSSGTPGGSGGNSPQSKLAGAAASSVALPRFSFVAASPTGGLALANGPINTQVIYQPPEPIVIPPNANLLVYGQTVNGDVSASWDWWEEAVQ